MSLQKNNLYPIMDHNDTKQNRGLSEMIDDIGGRLRSVRKSKGMTLAELADHAELSVSYISNLERNLCSPTLENLQKICATLGVSLMNLLDNKVWIEGVVRAEDRDIVYEQKGQIRYESINFGPDKLNGLLIAIEPNCVYKKEWHHEYDEIGYVMEGELTLSIKDKEFVLRKGDSFYIGPNDKHNISNRTDKPCISYWVKRGE